MTGVGLAVGAALALVLLAGELARTLRAPQGRPGVGRLSATAWGLGGAFLTLAVARLAEYLQ